MSFGENVAYYRKKRKITQEELAERLCVSRQTVSRWETDSTFPDVDMLITLCDTFECDMDTLVRGNAEASNSHTSSNQASASCDMEAYDKHMNRFALLIAAGVGLILIGVSVMCFLATTALELWSVVILLACIAAAVADFIATGVLHSNFMREHPYMSPYPEEKKKRFSGKMIAMLVTAVALIFIGVIFLVLIHGGDGSYVHNIPIDTWEHLSAGSFMLLVAISVFLFVFTGILYSKYNVKEYNEDCIKEGYAEGELAQKDKGKQISDTVSSVIMMLATIIFLICGFTADLWHPAWVAFPIGGICCGIASVILEAIFKK